MKRHTRILSAVVQFGAAVALGACSLQPAPTPGAESSTQITPVATTAATQAAPTAQAASSGATRTRDGQVIVNARVEPASSAAVSFVELGVVAEVFVKPGDLVEAGDILAQLDARSTELSIKEAEAALQAARANYEQLLEGASPAQVAAAHADLDRARAQLQQRLTSVTPQDIAAAKAELQEARAVLAKLQTGPKSEDIQILQAELDNARAFLQSVRDSLSAEKNRTAERVEQLANEVRNRQDNYERIYWYNENKGRDNLTQSDIDAEAAALRALENAESQLVQAQLTYEEAQKDEITGIQRAEAGVVEAEARLNRLFLPPDPDQLAAAQKRIARAEAELARLTGANYVANIQIAEAGVAEAEARIAELLSDPSNSHISEAEADVLRAEIRLEQEKLALERLTLRAPISGTVAQVNTKPGDRIKADNVPFVIADLNEWQIKTDNLNELDIVYVREGDKAVVTFFALPGFELPGTVSYIETMGRAGDVGTVYTVFIKPDHWDERLRWNMTATVTIQPGQ